jgi:hypothetical protein
VSNSLQNLPLFVADLLTIRQPPRELLSDVRSLIKDALSYNHLLKAHPTTPVSQWPTAEKGTFMAIVDKAKLLTLAFEGMLVSDNPLASPRRFWGDSATNSCQRRRIPVSKLPRESASSRTSSRLARTFP